MIPEPQSSNAPGAPWPARVEDIMRTDVVSVSANTSVGRIAELMHEMAISGMPVVDDTRRVVGIVTDIDLIVRNTRIEPPAYLPILEGRIPLETQSHFERRIQHMVGMQARDVMTDAVTTTTPDASIETLSSLMVKKRVDLVPVVEEGRLVGVVSRADVIRWMTRDPGMGLKGDTPGGRRREG